MNLLRDGGYLKVALVGLDGEERGPVNPAANPFALHDQPEQGRLAQWLVSAIAIGVAHLGLIAAAFAWYQHSAPAGIEMPAIMVDLAPAAPALQPQDLAPGPPMQESARRPEPESMLPETTEQTLQPEPVPVAPKPDVVVPDKAETPNVSKHDTAKPVRDRAKRETKKPVKQAGAQPSRNRRRTRTRAPHHRRAKSPAQAALASHPNAGAAAAAASAALPSYRDRLAAHLPGYKQYPSAAKAAGEQGTAMLSFTVGRGGQLLGSHLARSSGRAALDAETLAMVRRAQPLPAFPPEMTRILAELHRADTVCYQVVRTSGGRGPPQARRPLCREPQLGQSSEFGRVLPTRRRVVAIDPFMKHARRLSRPTCDRQERTLRRWARGQSPRSGGH